MSSFSLSSVTGAGVWGSENATSYWTSESERSCASEMKMVSDCACGEGATASEGDEVASESGEAVSANEGDAMANGYVEVVENGAS